MAEAGGQWRRDGGAGGGQGAPPKGPKAAGAGGSKGSRNKGKASKKSKAAAAVPTKPDLPLLEGASHSLDYLTNVLYRTVIAKVEPKWIDNPKNPLNVYVNARTGQAPQFATQEGRFRDKTGKVHRTTVVADPELQIFGYGDGSTVKESQHAAALDAALQLAERGLLGKKPPPIKAVESTTATDASTPPVKNKLSNGTFITVERAREFLDFYCQEFHFGNPLVEVSQDQHKKGKKVVSDGWKAVMIVGGSEVGTGSGSNKKTATTNCYIDTVVYLESADPALYARFDMTHKPGASITASAHVYFKLSDDIDATITDLTSSTKQSLLYSKRPRPAGVTQPGERTDEIDDTPRARRFQPWTMPSDDWLQRKSDKLLQKLQDYQVDDRVKAMRKSREHLPVHQNITDILTQVELNQVSICMAATGSGKSTQVPQLLLDDAILQGKGALCNVICTQPRRIAAISLAQRVANERGESLGESVGYQVRFDQKPAQPHGSITYCTTGVFMRRLQSALGDTSGALGWLDTITAIVLDEVHERDVQTDLLLVVLKKVMEERRLAGKPDIKVVLMSATVDPKLFTSYFADQRGRPAPVVDIPGRAYPVEKRFMEETVPRLQSLKLPYQAGGWVWQQKNVQDYLHRELQMRGGMRQGGEGEDVIDDLEIPYPLVSLYIADAIVRSDDGHVLVFLPGWDEIKVVHSQLTNMTGETPLLGLNFNDPNRFEVHILHSSIPVADQQAVFSPPAHKGIRRVILATNIAETSVTIPDVTVVIDTGRVKENRYDPSRHLSSLVSAWVGTSNLNQRAGRAGRHRPGVYLGVLSKARYDKLAVHQTVEMQRADLTDVVLHIKALDIAGLEPEDVLAAAIEPPSQERVQAAMEQLFTIGALDAKKALTSLGAVLLQLPVDAAVGKMVLYGLFFRCVEPTVSLAAILTSRDPFLAPIDVRAQAAAIKESWSPSDYRSDALAILRAYQTWSKMQNRGEYQAANRFCSENFLSKPTLLQIQQVAKQLVQSMGSMIEVILGSAFGGNKTPSYSEARFGRSRMSEATPELNVNSECTPLLAALIAMASTPNFAIRKSERMFQTSQDKACFIHPSSVCHLKHTKGKEDETQPGEKELFTFGEKTRNVSMATSGSGGGGSPMTTLRTVTRLDPLTYMLFGAVRIHQIQEGVQCDEWLPVRGHFEVLDDVARLKGVIDACMLRVFEGIGKAPRRPKSNLNGPSANRGVRNNLKGNTTSTGANWDDDKDDEFHESRLEDGPDEDDTEMGDRTDLSLAPREIEEFNHLTSGIVHILDRYASERTAALSYANSGANSHNGTRPSSPGFGGGGVGLNLGYQINGSAAAAAAAGGTRSYHRQTGPPPSGPAANRSQTALYAGSPPPAGPSASQQHAGLPTGPRGGANTPVFANSPSTSTANGTGSGPPLGMTASKRGGNMYGKW